MLRTSTSPRTPRSTATPPLVQPKGELDLTALQARMRAANCKGKLVFLKPGRNGNLQLKLVDPKSKGAPDKISRYSQSDVLQPKLEATARQIAQSKSGPVQDAAQRMFQSQLPKATTRAGQQRPVVAYSNRLEADLDLLAKEQRRMRNKPAPLMRRQAQNDLSHSSSSTHSASGGTAVAAISDQDLNEFAHRLNTTRQYGREEFFLEVVGTLVCNQAKLWRDGGAADSPKDFDADLQWLLSNTSLRALLSPEVLSTLKIA